MISWWMAEATRRPGGSVGSRAAVPWLGSPTMATRWLQCAFPSMVFSYVGVETRGTHLWGPLKAASTGKWRAMVASFTKASVKAWAHDGGPLALGQGLVAVVWPPCWRPQVRDALWQNHLKNEGFVSQDHIGGFSTKRECANTHK
jgi:hypothetical protein